MADRLALAPFVDALLDSVPDGERDRAAVDLVGVAAAHLTALVGSRAAAAVLYGIADMAATRHITAAGGEA